jgi:hypothetical protein
VYCLHMFVKSYLLYFTCGCQKGVGSEGSAAIPNQTKPKPEPEPPKPLRLTGWIVITLRAVDARGLPLRCAARRVPKQLLGARARGRSHSPFQCSFLRSSCPSDPLAPDYPLQLRFSRTREEEDVNRSCTGSFDRKYVAAAVMVVVFVIGSRISRKHSGVRCTKVMWQTGNRTQFRHAMQQ